jgi:threonine aldolase
MIDLRSDTRTRLSAGLRAATASAVVGDERRREDPTVCALEERAAAYLGAIGGVADAFACLVG